MVKTSCLFLFQRVHLLFSRRKLSDCVTDENQALVCNICHNNRIQKLLWFFCFWFKDHCGRKGLSVQGIYATGCTRVYGLSTWWTAWGASQLYCILFNCFFFCSVEWYKDKIVIFLSATNQVQYSQRHQLTYEDLWMCVCYWPLNLLKHNLCIRLFSSFLWQKKCPQISKQTKNIMPLSAVSYAFFFISFV